MGADLTPEEVRLLSVLPKPPPTALVRATNVWIIEWLPNSEQRRTGLLLHQWMQERRPSWSSYTSCQTKAEVLASIERATAYVGRTNIAPLLHIEAHGGEFGLEGPNGKHGRGRIRWIEFTYPLQRLNVATRCNLIVFVAACTGFAAIQALVEGPRAPAVALIGPDGDVTPKDLLEGAKEFYRRLMDREPNLSTMTDSASHEVGTVVFEPEPFVILAYESLVEHLIVSMRPEEQLSRKERLRKRMVDETALTREEIDERVAQLSPAVPQEWQQVWDEMFMIDLHPENQARFGLDMATIVRMVLHPE